MREPCEGPRVDDRFPVEAELLRDAALDLGDADPQIDLGRPGDLQIVDDDVLLAGIALRRRGDFLGDIVRGHGARQNDPVGGRRHLDVRSRCFLQDQPPQIPVIMAHDDLDVGQWLVVRAHRDQRRLPRLASEHDDAVGRGHLDIGDRRVGDEHAARRGVEIDELRRGDGDSQLAPLRPRIRREQRHRTHQDKPYPERAVRSQLSCQTRPPCGLPRPRPPLAATIPWPLPRDCNRTIACIGAAGTGLQSYYAQKLHATHALDTEGAASGEAAEAGKIPPRDQVLARYRACARARSACAGSERLA